MKPIALFVVITAFLVIGYLLLPNSVTNAVHSVGKPLWQSAGWLTGRFDNTVAYFQSKTALQEKNKELAEELENADLRLKQLELITNTNQELRDMWRHASTTEGILASVLTRPPQSPYDMIVLGVGVDQGVQVKDSITRSGISLGEVTSVYSQTAIGRLYTTPGVVTEGIITEADLAIDLTGAGGGSFTATAPKEVALEEGMTVVHSSGEGRILAEIVDIQVRPTDPFQLIRARSPANVIELQHVLIIDQQYNRGITQ